MRERLPLLIGLTLLSIAILLGAVAVGHGIRDRGKGDVVTVTGSAKQRITSDYAIWELSVSSQQAQAAPAAVQLRALDGCDPDVPEGAGRAAGGAYGAARFDPDRDRQQQPESDRRLPGGAQLRGAVAPRPGDRSVAEASSRLVSSGIPLQAQPLRVRLHEPARAAPKASGTGRRDAQNRGKVLPRRDRRPLGCGVDVGVFQVTLAELDGRQRLRRLRHPTLEKDVIAVVNVTFSQLRIIAGTHRGHGSPRRRAATRARRPTGSGRARST